MSDDCKDTVGSCTFEAGMPPGRAARVGQLREVAGFDGIGRRFKPVTNIDDARSIH
jgi:hypothetical protein